MRQTERHLCKLFTFIIIKTFIDILFTPSTCFMTFIVHILTLFCHYCHVLKLKCLLEQIKIFQCGRSQFRTKGLIWQRYKTIQGDVVGQVRVILISSKILQEHVSLPYSQEFRVQDLQW